MVESGAGPWRRATGRGWDSRNAAKVGGQSCQRSTVQIQRSGMGELHLALKLWRDREPSLPGVPEHSPGHRRPQDRLAPHGARPHGPGMQPCTPGFNDELQQHLQGGKGFFTSLLKTRWLSSQLGGEPGLMARRSTSQQALVNLHWEPQAGSLAPPWPANMGSGAWDRR